MEKSPSDILSDAFSETSVPSFLEDEELGFECLDFKDDRTILSHGNNNIVEQEDVSPLLETASASVNHDEHEILDAKNNIQEGYSSSGEECEENEAEIDEILENFMDKTHCSTQDNTGQNEKEFSSVLYQENIADKEDIAPILESASINLNKDDQEKLQAKNIQDVEVSERLEDCTSSEEESGEDEGKIEQKPGDFLETLSCSNDNEQVLVMGRDLGQKDMNQNNNQKESEKEKGSYFGSIQRNEGELTEDDSGEEELDTESTKTMFFQVEYTLEYPEIAYEESTDEVDKMEDFSGDEHQEAGESFADYPSDFSSCENVNDTRNIQESDFESQLECVAHYDLEATSEKGVDEVETENRLLNNDPVIECTGENNTGDDELGSQHEMGLVEMDDQDMSLEVPENKDNDVIQSWTEDVFSTWCNPEEDTKSPSPDITSISVVKHESDVDQHMPYMNYEEMKCLIGEEAQVQTVSSHGSVDDSFFFNEEKVCGVTEEELMEDDEEEEKRREQERIQAFYRFYDDQDGDSNKQERQTKVQFCTETLSQVNYYDSDSSERESMSTSSDEGEKDQDPEQILAVETCSSLRPDGVDLSLSQEPQEYQDQTQKDSPSPSEIANPESNNKLVSNRNQKCLSVLKLILSLFFAVVMGLIMFWWWVTDAEGMSPFVL